MNEQTKSNISLRVIDVAITRDFVSAAFVEESGKSVRRTFLRNENPRLFKRALLAAENQNFTELYDLSLNVFDNLRDIDNRFEIRSGEVFFDGIRVDNFVTRKISENYRKGLPVTNWVNFLKNTMTNRHAITVEDLYRFLDKHEDCPITMDGAFLAYKKVDHDYYSFFSGKNGKKERWAPGDVPELPREECDSDRNKTCSSGLHFCSREYLPNFFGSGGKVVMVKVFPQDVVAIPYDYNNAKGRCCKAHSLREIPDLNTFAFGTTYSECGYEVYEDEYDEQVDSELFEHVEKRVREYVFFKQKRNEPESRSISEFCSDVYDYCVEQDDFGFVYDEEDVLFVLEESEDPIVRDGVKIRAIRDVIVEIGG